jgi:iron complex transport system ATP-binding protein
MSGEVLICGEGLSWSAGGRRILGPLELSILAGESLAVVGPNGAGKTTLLRLLAGVLRPSTGRLTWRGRRYEDLGPRALARHIGYLPQGQDEAIPLTVGDMARLARHPHRAPWSLGLGPADREAVARALVETGLETLADRPLAELSGGERQMALLAAVCAQEPTLWALDEPTGHLDPRHHLDVAGLLRRRHRGGETLVFVTHELALAGHLATRVVALAEGRILADGPPESVLAPQVLESLFSAAFRVPDAPGPIDPRLRYAEDHA